MLNVTPLAGVWIEIQTVEELTECRSSVTPLAGVWIEIQNVHGWGLCAGGHSPCGSVD